MSNNGDRTAVAQRTSVVITVEVRDEVRASGMRDAVWVAIAYATIVA